MEERLNKEEIKQAIRNIFTIRQVKRKLPILTWLPKYRLNDLQGDVIAGLTVGLTVIPQGLALSKVAGLPPQYGLYTAFMGCFAYVFFGTSKDITVGPTAIMSLLVARFGTSVIPGDATYAVLLTLFGGIIQFILGLFQLGLVVDYVSHPVIDAFTHAASITIAEGQVKNWFGLTNVPRDFLEELFWTLKKIPETRLWDFILGVVCIIALLFLKYMKRFRFCHKRNEADTPGVGLRIFYYVTWLISIARNAIVVLLSAVVVIICKNYYHVQPFSTTSNVTPGLPPFKPPNFVLVNGNQTTTTAEVFANIGAGFAIIPILGLVETMAIGKVFAKKNGYKIDPSQEFIAVGVCNVMSCFVSSYPVTGSFSRTAVNSQSGVRTPAGGIITGLLVMISLLFLTPYFHYIPNATLAVVIICAVIDMLNFKIPIKLWRVNKIDLFCWVVTFILSLAIGIEYGILSGIGLSLLILLCVWGRPGVKDVTTEALQSIDTRITFGVNIPEVVVLRIEHGLLFPSIERFSRIIKEKIISNDGRPRAGIIDCIHITKIDYSVIEGICCLLQDLELNDCILIWVNFKTRNEEDMKKCNASNFFTVPSVDEALHLIKGYYDDFESTDIRQSTSVEWDGTRKLGEIKHDQQAK